MRHLAAYLLLSVSPLLAQIGAVEFVSPQERESLNHVFRERIQAHQFREGNGDIIGNGAGLAELNFAYVYRSVPTLIDRYLNAANFNLSQNDKDALLHIKSIVEERKSYANVFEFLEETDLMLLFPQENDRIAMTAFTPDFPIYINKTLLYQTPELTKDLPLQASIIIHELGHQAGIKSHKYLDYLGAAVQTYLQSRFSSHTLDMAGSLSISIFNRAADDYDIPQTFITHLGQSVEATHILRASAVCPDGKQALTFDIRNGHWERPEDETRAKFNFWSKLICPHRGSTRSYERDYSMIIKVPTLEIEVLELE